MELKHRQRLGRLNSIVAEIIQQRRSLRVQNGADAGSSSSSSSSAATAAIAGALDADATGDSLAAGGGSGKSLSGKEIFAGGCDMLDMMLDSGVPMTDKQVRCFVALFAVAIK